MAVCRLSGLLAAWITTVACGGYVVYRYETTGTTPLVTAVKWPVDTQLRPSLDLPTLVMFAHPHCPCTRASLAELTALMTACRDRLSVRVVFIRPAGFALGWEQTDLWRAAGRLPVSMLIDADGEEARRFGARVSGEVFLFDSHGALVFHGGITNARGHAGTSAGRSAIEEYVAQGTLAVNRTPVYGCQLFSE